MPLPCAAGTAKPGVDPVVTLAGSGLAGFLTRILGPKAAPFAAVLGYVSQQTSGFCAAGPPVLPTLTATDYANLILESLGIASPDSTVVAKLTDVVHYYLWYDLCQCVGVATPPPTLSVEPPSAPGLNDGYGPPPNSPCIDVTKGVNGLNSGFTRTFSPSDIRPIGSLTEQFFSSATLTTAVMTNWDGAPTVPAVKLPNPLPINLTGVVSDVVAQQNNFAQTLCCSILNAAGAITTDTFILHGFNGSVITQPSVPYVFKTGDDRLVLFNIVGGQPAGGGYQAHVQLNCTGAGVSSACCPPDPTTNALLVQIKNLIEALQLGGGGGPTSWKDGPRHTLLGDHGHFVLSKGAVGVRAEVHTLPPTSPPHTGDPTYYYDLGFVTPMAIDVPLRGQRLLFNPQSFALPQFADGVAYTFLHGTQADLVELLPV